jgi:hypothetical protein
VTDLKKFGYTKINQLDRVINESKSTAETLEKEELHRTFYSDTGLVRICLMLCDDNFYEAKRRVHEKENKRLFRLIGKYRLKLKNKKACD